MSEETREVKVCAEDATPILSQEFMDFMTKQVAERKKKGVDTGNAVDIRVVLLIDEDGSLILYSQEVNSGTLKARSEGSDE